MGRRLLSGPVPPMRAVGRMVVGRLPASGGCEEGETAWGGGLGGL